jgi:hypothetical protein
MSRFPCSQGKPLELGANGTPAQLDNPDIWRVFLHLGRIRHGCAAGEAANFLKVSN